MHSFKTLPMTVLLLALPGLSAARAEPLGEPAAPQTQSSGSEPAGFGKLDPTPPAGGLTPAQIVAKMGEREADFARARLAYTFRQSVKVQTISDDNGKPDGEYQQVTDIVFNKDGKREEFRVQKILGFQGLKRFELAEGRAGDILAVTGMEELNVGETVTEIERPRILPLLTVDEPPAAGLQSDQPAHRRRNADRPAAIVGVGDRHHAAGHERR